MNKAIIYLRTSTEEQHPEKQEQECIALANNKGYEILDIKIEKLSAYKQIVRPEYESIKELARKGEIKAVIVWALDRWVRNRDTLLEDVTILKSYGCKLHSVKDSWLEAMNIEGALGRTLQDFMLGLIGSLAELESERKAERVKMAYKSHKGNWGRPKTHTNKKKLVWELREQGKSIRQISKEVSLSIGKVSEICSEKHLQNLRIKTPKNNQFINGYINEQ